MRVDKFRIWLCFTSVLLGMLWGVIERLLVPQLSAKSGLITGVGFGLITWVVTTPTFFKKYVGKATPESLGIIRVITCTVLLIMTLWVEELPSIASLPEEIQQAFPDSGGMIQFFYMLPGFEKFVRSENCLLIFQWLTRLLLLLGAIGWRTRVVIPLATLCYFLQGGILRQYTVFFHSGLIPIYVMAVLSLTPCGDGLSVDRLRKIRQGKTVPVADFASSIYGWSRYACWVVIVLPYVVAGMSKLRNGGFLWWDATNMRQILYFCTLDSMMFKWDFSLRFSHAPDIFFACLGLIALGSELAFGLVLVSKKARKIMPIFMIIMHLGIFFLQNLLFLDLIFLQLVFFDFLKVKNIIVQRITLNLKYIKIRSNKVSCFFKQIGHHLNGRKIYLPSLLSCRNTTSNRFKFANRAQKLVMESLFKKTHGGNLAVFSYQENISNFFYPLVISSVTIVFFLSWSRQIEFYPLTAMPMYSYRDTSGLVVYNKILAHDETGIVFRPYPEKIVPAIFAGDYRGIINLCFSKKTERVKICDQFLLSLGHIYNRKAHQGYKITKFELQQWQWNFRLNPSDVNHGKLVKRHFYEI
jgi:hypothetical protein